jgi:hypothetical protein
VVLGVVIGLARSIEGGVRYKPKNIKRILRVYFGGTVQLYYVPLFISSRCHAYLGVHNILSEASKQLVLTPEACEGSKELEDILMVQAVLQRATERRDTCGVVGGVR